ncbi:MAG: FecR domain-containing protein [Pyrinomonadaceae bacterium]
MRKARPTLVSTLFVAALALALPLALYSQNREKFVISAKAGGVNAVTGRASMRPHGNTEWQQLTIKEDLEAGDVVKTGLDSRVEMLLNPGSYMRVGENSEFELADNSVENLEVRLIRGTAIVEVTGADDEELFIGITTPHTRMSIIRRGLYRVSVVPGDNTELIVRKGRVMLEGSHTKVKGGNKVVFSSSSFSVAKLENAEKKDRDALEAWSKERAQTLARANSRISGRTLTAFVASFGTSYAGRRSGLWLFNTDIGCYTLVPFGFGWESPYGGWYSRFYYGGGYCCGQGPIYGGPIITGNRGGSTTSGSGSGSGGPAHNPPPSPGRSADSPRMGHGKPDISPGGDGPVRGPIKE